MKYAIISFLIIFLFGCQQNNGHRTTNATGETVRQRILVPDGYEWMVEENNSFAEFLQRLTLKPHGSAILDFNNNPISNQSAHVAIIDYEVGNRDLQQCADALIRLHAEYLYEQERFDEIAYHFTNGDLFSWEDYKKGVRPQLQSANQVSFSQVAAYDDSYHSFRKYLDVIFMYAGTISLNRETVPVTRNENIKTGDMIITPGSPGHAVIIVGTAINNNGNKIYLLAQGYTPAQSIHVLSNPINEKLNPWYELDVEKSPTTTARYTFSNTNIRSFR